MTDNKFYQIKKYFSKHLKITIYTIVFLIHLFVFLGMSLRFKQPEVLRSEVIEIFDFRQEKAEDTANVQKQKKLEYTEAEKIIVKKDDTKPDDQNKKKDVFELDAEGDYNPQYKLTNLPVMPEDEIRSRIQYPPLANKQGIEGVVFLELYIDKNGNIRDIKVLKDPGYGFAEAALKAFEGIKCLPAKIDGSPVAAIYRYPIRFTLRK